MTRFDALLFDAGGVFVIPDPVAIGAALEPWLGLAGPARFHRAHYAGLRALETGGWSQVAGGDTPVPIEMVDWGWYRAGYIASLGLEAAPGDATPATDALRRIWSPGLWRFRIEESVAALWQLSRLGVPMGIVSNASGQIAATLAQEGVCQVGPGSGVRVACVVDSHDAGVAKPDPAIFAPALDALGAPDPSRVAYIGDSLINDVGGATAAGLVPLQLDPYGDYAACAHERIASLHDLLAMVV